MSEPFAAIITPIADGAPDNDLPLPMPPPSVWPPDPAHPEQPIRLPPPHISTGPVEPPTIWPPGEINNDLPLPPPVVWPPIPGSPDNTLPPPVGVWPPAPIFPANPIAGVPPGTVWPPLPMPPHVGGGPVVHEKLIVIVWVPGVGYRWVVVDPNAHIEHPVAGTPQPK
jgi:hypothetical protein